jgi:hypothetical protein
MLDNKFAFVSDMVILILDFICIFIWIDRVMLSNVTRLDFHKLKFCLSNGKYSSHFIIVNTNDYRWINTN